jgi:hypothetical protein
LEEPLPGATERFRISGNNGSEFPEPTAVEEKLGIRLPRISVWVSRKGRKFVDANQRMRSFLYMAIASGVAMQLGINEVHFYENGITTFNPPISEQRIGTRSTRTTRPRVLREFSDILRSVFSRDFSINNPFVFKTKGDVVNLLKEAGVPELIGETVSCSRTIGVPRETPHCGVCYQCVCRRFAVLAGDAEDFDPVSHYAKDIFTDALDKGEEQANVLDWIRFNQRVEEMSPEAFYDEYTDLHDSFEGLGRSAAEVGNTIFDLFKRNAQQVKSGYEKQHRQNFNRIYRSEVSSDSLLGLIGSGSIKNPPIVTYVQRVSAVIERGLRTQYSNDSPRSESDMQRTVKANLLAADEKLRKEYPTFAYSIGAAKPDFSSPENLLFVETKLLKDTSKRTALVDQIIADIVKYSALCTAILFVIFQNTLIIADPLELTSEFEKYPQAFFKVIP